MSMQLFYFAGKNLRKEPLSLAATKQDLSVLHSIVEGSSTGWTELVERGLRIDKDKDVRDGWAVLTS